MPADSPFVSTLDSRPQLGFEPVPFRIRVGVTGHRTLPDAESVRQIVHDSLRNWTPTLFPVSAQGRVHRVLAKGHTPLAYTILSPLAEGADRVVANAVLELPDSQLEAVLPLPIDEYKKDFSGDGSLAEFDSLLARSAQPLCLMAEEQKPSCAEPAPYDRKLAYENVGRYVVNHCDLLLAVWNGGPSRGRGGTAEIVAYAQEQHIPVLHIWSDKARLLNPDRFARLDAEALCGLDRWNRTHIHADRYADAFSAEEKSLFAPLPASEGKPPQEPPLSEPVKQLVRTKMLTYYARGSAIAEACRDRFQGGGWKIYFFSALAVAFAALGVVSGEWHLKVGEMHIAPFCFLFELLLLVFMVSMLKRTHHAQTHPDWIENRFLTERIRCAAFLAICGVQAESIDVPPFMGAQPVDRSWMARVLDEMWLRMPRPEPSGPDQVAPLRQYLSQRWLLDQIRYHHSKSARENRMLLLYATGGKIVVPATMAVAALHFAMGLHEFKAMGVRVFESGMTILALTLPAVAAMLVGIETYREFRRLSVRSAMMETRLEQLNRRLLSASTPGELFSLLRRIDKVMLQETQDWMTLMRYVEIKAG